MNGPRQRGAVRPRPGGDGGGGRSMMSQNNAGARIWYHPSTAAGQQPTRQNQIKQANVPLCALGRSEARKATNGL